MKFKVASVRFSSVRLFSAPDFAWCCCHALARQAATATPDRSGFTARLRQTLLIDSFTLASTWFDIARRKE